MTVWINSPGGDVVAAAQIYNMLLNCPGHVKVCIDGIAASAASVIAMAGEVVAMSPVSMLMITTRPPSPSVTPTSSAVPSTCSQRSKSSQSTPTG
nr:ATP-dependent Clp protease proteolytic subunit [Brevibacterium sp. Marseille-P9724]